MATFMGELLIVPGSITMNPDQKLHPKWRRGREFIAAFASGPALEKKAVPSPPDLAKLQTSGNGWPEEETSTVSPVDGCYR